MFSLFFIRFSPYLLMTTSLSFKSEAQLKITFFQVFSIEIFQTSLSPPCLLEAFLVLDKIIKKETNKMLKIS